MTTTAERFWARVERTDLRPKACWSWRGRMDVSGYGRVGFAGKQNVKAHRVAWMLTFGGGIPAGAVVMHQCDNPACVRPSHLRLGTQLENVADRDAKGRGVAPPSRAKLTDEHVRQARAEYERGLTTQAALAERYGISRGNLSKILNRRLYTHA